MREIGVTDKPNKTKLQAGQDKFRQSRPDKHQPCGHANSVQSLWSVTSNGNMILQGYTVTP